MFDALVLLGCRVTAGDLPPAAARRVASAAAAFAQQRAPRVVVSGGRAWEGLVEAERLADELVRAGVPREALLLERASLTTFENAVKSAELLAPRGWRRVGVVTCDWHLPRALWSFRRVGLDATGVPAVSPPVTRRRRAWRALREQGAWLLERGRGLV